MEGQRLLIQGRKGKPVPTGNTGNWVVIGGQLGGHGLA